LLIALSSGTNSIFFFFFFFATLYTSFIYGFSSGLKVTIVSAVAFTIIGYLSSPSGLEFELNRFLLRPIYLMVLGYMVAYWGEYEIRTKRRLALLREIVTLSNPRFGVERTIGGIIELFRDFYDADGCLLIMRDAETDEYIFHRADRKKAENSLQSHPVNPQLAEKLFLLPAAYAAVFQKTRNRKFYVFDVPEKQFVKENGEVFETIAERLDTNSYLTVPVYYRSETVGRIYIFSQKSYAFDQTDIDFLLQAIDQFMPVIENIRLVDHLASDAAEEERKKIARDIHDSIVQPYIGLQLGIDSIEQFFDDEEKDFKAKEEVFKKRIKKLRELTEKGIDDLRGYIRGLSKARGYEASLLPAIRRYGERFTGATGIAVEIEAEENIQIADRLAAEMFQIVAEGLSNIRRHTASTTALITLTTSKDKLILAIINNNDNNDIVHFTPRSISERVKALGGFLEIRRETGKTVARIEIPL
jgi:signal transduction histidine kinase